MKKFLLASLLLTGLIVFQISGQELSIDQAVLQTGLYPARPSFVWGGPAGGFLQIKNGSIVSVQAKSNKESIILTRDEFNQFLQASGLAALLVLPLPEVLPSGYFRFKAGSAIVDFDWNQKKLAGIFNTPEVTGTLILAPSGSMAAYTIEQNVFYHRKYRKKDYGNQ